MRTVAVDIKDEDLLLGDHAGSPSVSKEPVSLADFNRLHNAEIQRAADARKRILHRRKVEAALDYAIVALFLVTTLAVVASMCAILPR